MSFDVFKYFFDGRDGQNEDQRQSSGVSTRRRDIRYLLHKCYKQEEYICVAVELLEKEFGDKGDQVIFGGCYAVITELVATIDVKQSHRTGMSATHCSARVVS